MSLLDIAIGEGFRITPTIRQANIHVCEALRPFVTSRTTLHPKSEDFFATARRHLYSFYISASACVFHCLNEITVDFKNTFRNYKIAIESLTTREYLFLLSSLHTGFIVSNFLKSQNQRNAQSWFYVCSEGVCDMYGRPDSYMVEWIDSFDWLTESNEHISGRLMYKVIDEINEVLGVKSNLPDIQLWTGTLANIANHTEKAFADSIWLDMVDDEISNLT